MKLYYVESERLQPVKDQCRRLLSNGRTGLQPSMEQINLEHLCGIVKHFLSDICEPVFSANIWKDYSIHIRKYCTYIKIKDLLFNLLFLSR